MPLFMKVLAWIILLLSGKLLLAANDDAGAKPGAKRPNIVLILMDDMPLAQAAYMPRVNALIAKQGAVFENYYCSSPLCVPSRASMLTGRYAQNTKVLVNKTNQDGAHKKYAKMGHEQASLPNWLQAVGYRTALYGKYLNGFPARNDLSAVPPAWNEWCAPVDEERYGQRKNLMCENGKLIQYGDKDEEYGTDIYRRKADAFIRATVTEERPFFVFLSMFVPHAPATPAPRHAALFEDVKLPRPANLNEEDVSDKPEYIRKRDKLSDEQIKRLEVFYRKQLQSLQAVDEMVEHLLKVLEQTKQLDNTYIVFTSDNGFHLGNHRMERGKEAPYEEESHLPLFVRGPGIAAGTTITHLVGNIDLAPTLLQLSGATIPAIVDGRSLVPLWSTKPPAVTEWRQAYLLEHGSQDTPALDIPAYQGLRTLRHIYVEYATGERELYDTSSDPCQLSNLINSASPQLVQELAERLRQLRGTSAKRCREVEELPFAHARAQSDSGGAEKPK